jgi:hypothetical protein
MERLPEVAAELVRRQVAVIVTAGGFATALAAKGATTTIPILFSVSDDPVKHGLVASLARPGGNLTGINLLSTELTAKRLELLREMLPRASRIAVLVNPANAVNTQTTLREVKAAGPAVGFQMQIVNAGTSREIDTAFAAFARERPDAVFLGHGHACGWRPSGHRSAELPAADAGDRGARSKVPGPNSVELQLDDPRRRFDLLLGRPCRAFPTRRDVRRQNSQGGPPSYPSSSRRSSSWSSTSRRRRRSASNCRQPCSPAPTR